MENVIRINRLNENHESLPEELTGMTVGELLDRMEQADNGEDIKYEMVELILNTIGDNSYESEKEFDDTNPVEVEDEGIDEAPEEDDEEADEGDFPSFSQVGKDNSKPSKDNSFDEFKF